MEKVTEADPEVKVKVCAITKDDESEGAEHDPMEKMVDHFNNRHALLRELARILQVRHCLRTKSKSLSRRLEAKDLKEAERLVIEW